MPTVQSPTARYFDFRTWYRNFYPRVYGNLARISVPNLYNDLYHAKQCTKFNDSIDILIFERGIGTFTPGARVYGRYPLALPTGTSLVKNRVASRKECRNRGALYMQLVMGPNRHKFKKRSFHFRQKMQLKRLVLSYSLDALLMQRSVEQRINLHFKAP